MWLKVAELDCIGCEMCVNLAPDLFKINEKGIAEVIKQPAFNERIIAQKAIDECPILAISMTL